MSIQELIAAHQPQLAALAESWLCAGAESFSVWAAGQRLACWPSDACRQSPALVAPILAGSRPLGELHVTGLDGVATASRLRAEAALLALAIQTEGELEQMTAELIDIQDQLLAMYDLGRSTRSYLELSTILAVLAREAARLVKASGAAVVLGSTLVQHPADLAEEAELTSLFVQAQRRGQVLLHRGSAGLPSGLENLCVVPIHVRNAPLCGIALLNKPGGFTSPDLKLAQALAEQAGAQIEHALLHQELLSQARLQAELELARKVQLHLLPPNCPQCPGLTVYAESRPALQVGGDFYDVIAPTDGPLMFTLGDVAGKGLSAALVMSMIHSTMRSVGRSAHGLGPADVLSRTNADLYDELTALETFTTAFVAQYDAVGQTLYYANAGHAPVIYRPPDGPARLLEGDGVPVGVLPDCQCENHSMLFEDGALLVVTTDGFSEARCPAGAMFGYERLLRAVDACASRPPDQIAAALFDAVARFSDGSPQEDDQTLVVIQRAAV